jgi:hypothetical protein
MSRPRLNSLLAVFEGWLFFFDFEGSAIDRVSTAKMRPIRRRAFFIRDAFPVAQTASG